MNMKNTSAITNPLMLIIFLLIALIIVLAIFRPASPYLNLGFGINAHLGDLKGSFEFEAFNNSEPMFVMYYAEWCGHCKTLEPKYVELAKLFAGNQHVVIAKMDSTANEVP